MKKSDTCLYRVKLLLENVPYLRDNKHLAIEHYRFSFPSDKSSEESISRVWRMVQQDYPELRGEDWLTRQRHARTVSNEIRNREKPEDLSNIFDPIEDVKKQSFFTRISSLFN